VHTKVRIHKMQPVLTRIFAFTMLLASHAEVLGQSRLSVKAADSLDFILYINEVAANNTPCISLTIDKLPAGKVTLRATSSVSQPLDILQTITLKKNSSAFYEIEKSKGAYKFVLKSESTLTVSEPISPQISETKIAAAIDTTTIVETTNPDGCNSLTSQESYKSMLSEVTNAYFETRKLEVMKQFISNSCLRVEQIRYMMSQLSMEDNKFILLRESLNHISDTSNLYRTEADFFLEKNKARVNELLANTKKNP
jgi:hypothetical protein